MSEQLYRTDESRMRTVRRALNTLLDEGALVPVEIDREVLVQQIAGLLSTIEFCPADWHPTAVGTYADAVMTLIEEAMGIGGDDE